MLHDNRALRLRGDFAADDDDVAFGVGLASDAAVRILRQAGVEHRIGNGVANFVRMAFADGFGEKCNDETWLKKLDG